MLRTFSSAFATVRRLQEQETDPDNGPLTSDVQEHVRQIDVFSDALHDHL